jgi:hypothetical protein
MPDYFLSFQDENQTATFSCGETEIQINSQDQAKKETVGHVTKRRRRHKRARGNLDSQVNGSVQTEKELPLVPKLVVLVNFPFTFVHGIRWSETYHCSKLF